ncbi:hypothetical protein [Dactylosporangium sp. NPDC000521]|uniref:DUF7669 domain-containing protein n=1 Tax=Dactylosporangium sp. NPDC000521 TaxID=3363975 RepID=UPI0036ABC081
MDVPELMAELAQRRPLFHSERDFQHALAWLIQQRHPEAELRLEPRPRRGIHLDLLVRLPSRRIAIELKYRVTAFTGDVRGERFELPAQGAHDVIRHDVVKDIVRLERIVADGEADEGVGLTLTNDGAYWRPGLKADPVDAAFRIHEGKVLTEALTWSALARAGTTDKRDTPLALAGLYTCEWRHYGVVTADSGRSSELRYLAFAVSREAPDRTAPPQRRSAAPSRTQSPAPIVTTPSTAREEILLAIADIMGRSGRDHFELSDVLTEMRQRGSRYAESTIRTHVTSRMCGDSPGHHASTFDDLQRLDRGRYRLRSANG